jgi:hypothetical protein
VETLQDGSDRGMNDYTILRMDTQIVQSNDLRELSSRLTRILRDSDAVGMDAQGNILLLLTNTTEDDSVFVMQRLQNAQIPTERVSA